MKKIHTPMSSSIGNHETKMFMRSEGSSSGFASTFTPYFRRSPTIHGVLDARGVHRVGLAVARGRLEGRLLSSFALVMCPWRASSMKVE